METFPVPGDAIETDRAGRLVGGGRPLVIAHRGYSAIAPENTLPSFALALQAGADLVELDYYHSKDGTPVVFHDATLDRTTNGQTLWGEAGNTVGTKTWAELRQLDSGQWFHPRYTGTSLLSLEQAVDEIQRGAVTLIERKSGDPDTLVTFLRLKKLVPEVVVQSFDWGFIEACHKIEPDLVLGCLGPRHPAGQRLTPEEQFLNTHDLDQIERAGAKVVGWNFRVTKEAVEAAHRRGLRVWVYVINDIAGARRLLDLGVDGLITDNPGLMWKALALEVAAERVRPTEATEERGRMA